MRLWILSLCASTGVNCYSNMHKGFKCLDISEGQVYISREVVFDETIYPFAQLHPNAGARLRVELSLLPNILLNPIASFGDAKLLDQCDVSMSTNGVQDAGTVAIETGENNGGDRHFMYIPGGERRHGARVGSAWCCVR